MAQKSRLASTTSEPQAAELAPAQAPDTQRFGNAAAQDALDVEDDVEKKKAGKSTGTVVDVAGQQVRVGNDEEAREAAEIIKQIEAEFGVKMDSQAGVEAIRSRYTWAPESERDKLATKEWTIRELRALQRALGNFSPLLGKERENSSRAGTEQEVQSASKVDHAISENSPRGKLDSSTLGEYFAKSKNFSMFSAGSKATPDFKDLDKQLEGTAVHEIAHGVMKQDLDSFLAATKYWTDRSTASGTPGAEAPISKYGQTNADEDLSEAVMFFFVEPATLKKKCPERYAWIEAVVAGWSKKGPASP